MATVSYLWDFTKAPHFFEFINKKFHISKMNGADNFEFVLASACPINIGLCIDANNILTSRVSVLSTVTGGLKFIEDEDGICYCRVAKDTIFDIGDSVVGLKAIFIRDKNTKSVLLYCINITPFNITNTFIFNKNSIVFTIRDGDVSG